MDPLLHIAETDRFFTRGQILDTGFAEREITAAVRAGTWVRVRRGSYTFGHLWAAAGPEERHRIRAAAVMGSLGDRVALSHATSVVHHGIDVWDLPLSRVHVTRLDGGPGRIEGDVVHHEALVLDDDVVEADGLRATTPARAVLEAGSRATGAARLAVVDSLLRHDPQAPLHQQFAQMQYWPFMRRMHVPVRMADPRPGSVGESVGRWFFWSMGLPAPVLQHEVWFDGRLVGTTDYAWPEHRVLGEFDGLVKYGRLLGPGQEASDVVVAEKIREDALREVTDHTMIRFTWADWSAPQVTAARLRHKLRLAG